MTNPPSTLTTARAEEEEPTGSDAGYLWVGWRAIKRRFPLDY